MGPKSLPRVRHLTATGFVVHEGRVLLHWHRKEQLWLPFGGHLEANEDPVECCLREVLEESGLTCEVFGSAPPFAFALPRQLPLPVTMLVEMIRGDGAEHEHIDLIYFCRPKGVLPEAFEDPTIRWLDARQLEENAPLAPAAALPPARIPDDVRALALEALRRAAAEGWKPR
jgi:8-oxo-dGTP pyrophosphatase MutT (NUDIX family)